MDIMDIIIDVITDAINEAINDPIKDPIQGAIKDAIKDAEPLPFAETRRKTTRIDEQRQQDNVRRT